MPAKSDQDPKLDAIRHSLAHLLAAAVLEKFPEAKLGVGPTIEHGFYYDFKLPRALTPADLPDLERTMRRLVKQNLAFEAETVPITEARALFKDQPFKLELINDLATKGTTVFDELQSPIATRQSPASSVTVYRTGRFLDLCRGGHVNSTKEIPADAFSLNRVAGAYWRGSEKNPMLQRVYGLAFAAKSDLEAYKKQQAEAEARDHRKIGVNLDLFSFDPVAPGAAFWHPSGMVIWNELERLLRETLTPAGYREIQTPLMVKPELFKRSGHLAHYKTNMFRVLGTDEEFYLKPMNCPESAIVFASRAWSYRDLPVRLAEFGRIHRNELSGTLGGLFRVRQITQDDGHIYCRPDQLETEITSLLKLSKRIYAIFNLKPEFFLSTKPDDAMGDPKRWEEAERSLAKALERNKLPYQMKPREGTFYAPKIDIDVTDSLRRRWQLCTIQADLVMVPNLPGVEYTDEHGKKQQPVVIHRAIFGSFERFIGILTEHYAGAFPLWLAPVQIQIMPVSEKHNRFSEKLGVELREAGLRVVVDVANETVGYKVRKAEKQKIPYLLVIGDKEVKSPKLQVRERGKKEIKVVAKKTFVARVQKDIGERK